MTLPTSFPLSLLQIKTEFGGAGNMLSYLAGGGNVPAATANGTGVTIPSSAPISFAELLGSSAAFVPITNTVNGLLTTNTTGTETAPARATNVFIEMWGTGGGGPGLTGLAGGGGAGSGAYCNIGPVLISSVGSIAWTLGGSGKGATAAVTPGVNGNTSSISDNDTGGSVISISGGEGQGGSSSAGAGGQFTVFGSPSAASNLVFGNFGTGSTTFNGGSAPNGGGSGGNGTSTGVGGNGNNPGGGGGGGATTGGNGGTARILFHYT
jgi:hypothetical protein